MDLLLKINAFSILYAFVLFLALELGLNFYRISDLFSLSHDVVLKMVMVLYFVGLIVCSFLFFKIAKKWMEKRKASFWSIILWFPYYILFTNLFPITDSRHEAEAGVGFAIMFAVFLYPLYLMILNVLATGVGVTED